MQKNYGVSFHTADSKIFCDVLANIRSYIGLVQFCLVSCYGCQECHIFPDVVCLNVATDHGGKIEISGMSFLVYVFDIWRKIMSFVQTHMYKKQKKTSIFPVLQLVLIKIKLELEAKSLKQDSYSVTRVFSLNFWWGGDSKFLVPVGDRRGRSRIGGDLQKKIRLKSKLPT